MITKNKLSSIALIIFGAIIGVGGFYCFNNFDIKAKKNNENFGNYKLNKKSNDNYRDFAGNNNYKNTNDRKESLDKLNYEIGDLTQEDRVVDYIKAHHELPDYYITKSEAKSKGWKPGSSLCNSVPGKAIGGDRFSNREKTLPTGKYWKEADINYKCGKRNADRLVFSDDEIYITHDHYKTFDKR